MAMDPPPSRSFTRGLAVGLALIASVGCAGCWVLPSAGRSSVAAPPVVPPPPPRSAAEERPRRDDLTRTGHHSEAALTPAPRVDAEPAAPAGPLPLPEAIAYALRFNPRLLQATAQVRAAQQGETIAFAPFLPEVNFNYVFAGFNRPVIPGGNFVPASLQAGVFHFSLAELGVQWTILDFGRRAGRYGQAVNRTNVEELILQRARQSVAYDVASAYFALLQARAQQKVFVEAVERSTAFRKDAGSRREGGTAEQESLFRTDVLVSRASEGLVAGEQAVLDAEAILNQALGRACGGSVAVVDLGRRPSCGDSREACLNRAVRLRAEIGAARQEIAAAGSGIQTARGEMLPLVYVRGTVIQADLGQIFNGIIDGAGVNVEQPIYNGGRKIAGLRLAQENAVAAAAGLRVILNNVSLQVNLAYNALATNRERIRLNGVGAKQARENLRVAIVRFNNGNAIPTEVIEAETALTEAEVNYYASVYGYLANLVKLEYAEGNDLDSLIAAAMGAPASPDEEIALPQDDPGAAPIPRIAAPPATPAPPDPPQIDLPNALPGPA